MPAPVITITFDEASLRAAFDNLDALRARLEDRYLSLHSDIEVSDSKGNTYVLFELLDKGTRAHLILPTKPGGVLAFQIETGETVFTRAVHHPGIQPRHFLRTALPVLSNWFASQAGRIARDLEARTFDPLQLFREAMEQLRLALVNLTPGQLKESFRIEVE
jgi:hypothetical protein